MDASSQQIHIETQRTNWMEAEWGLAEERGPWDLIPLLFSVIIIIITLAFETPSQ